MKVISQIGAWVFLITLFYALMYWLGAGFISNLMTFMFADYVAYFAFYIAPILPGFGNPIVLILIAAFIFVMFPGLLRISNAVAAFIVALCLVQLAFSLIGAEGAPAPSSSLMLLAAFAFGWMLLISAFADRGVDQWIED